MSLLGVSASITQAASFNAPKLGVSEVMPSNPAIKKGDKIHRPNGSDYYSSGNYENLDLQRASTIKKAKRQLEDYIPQQALHIIENEFIAMIPEMDEELEELTTLAIDTIVTESFTLP